jgi:integrase/recombinase XerD
MTQVAAFSEWQVYDRSGRRKYVTGDERGRFLSAADEFPAQAQVFCYVLVFTGCRVSEALGLFPHHHDAERSTLTFRTLKRRKLIYRCVPIPLYLNAMLMSLPAVDGWPFWVMHRVTAWRYVRHAMVFAGIIGPMACCKGLRHGFGIRAIDRGTPLNLVKKWMGHARLETTEIYMDAVGFEERTFASRMWL